MKAGKTTSEYWATVISSGIVLLNQVTGSVIEDNSTLIVAGLVAVYTLGRSIIKAFSKEVPSA